MFHFVPKSTFDKQVSLIYRWLVYKMFLTGVAAVAAKAKKKKKKRAVRKKKRVHCVDSAIKNLITIIEVVIELKIRSPKQENNKMDMVTRRTFEERNY